LLYYAVKSGLLLIFKQKQMKCLSEERLLF